jgi:hypothetical protein
MKSYRFVGVVHSGRYCVQLKDLDWKHSQRLFTNNDACGPAKELWNPTDLLEWSTLVDTTVNWKILIGSTVRDATRIPSRAGLRRIYEILQICWSGPHWTILRSIERSGLEAQSETLHEYQAVRACDGFRKSYRFVGVVHIGRYCGQLKDLDSKHSYGGYTRWDSTWPTKDSWNLTNFKTSLEVRRNL